ncbi:plasmid replication initiator TrfA [Arsenophonus nasoniae]|uniref:Plasmid replication initiator TrfA n=1 Tax=Arsenophonus nasoniae TaxID=638 RepID=A0ABY8NWT0_9GAMM|nr:plasmid replication initiator TrfA [Arsenophonus nasoniae]WGM08851.1 plasmid replication initiator TrfA [Arsenophonus nasoniae]
MKNIWNKVDFIAKKIAENKDCCVNSCKENPSLITENNIKQEQIVESENEIYLPISIKNKAPVPNIILRSALFGLVAKGTRKYEKSVLKATVNGYEIKYTGEQLDQSDLDVWLECLQRCQESPLGNAVKFSSYDFLLSIRRNTGKTQYKWLDESLNRMKANAVQLSDKKYTYIGSLINEIYRDEETGLNCLVLNPKIVNCFGDAEWTGIVKALRLKLKGKPLTQWLHGFYSSHSKPVPIKVETLKRLCGSERGELRKFRYDLKKSLSELSNITGWNCIIDQTDKVIVSKK